MNLDDLTSYSHIVWDGNNLAWRYMKRPFLFWEHNGRKTGVIHGVLNSVLALKKSQLAKKVFVCWDHSVNKRKDLDPTYKANRDKGRYTDSNELGEQIEVLHNNLKRFGVASVKREGYEADDVCYSVVRALSDQIGRSERILLVSKDHDFQQVINLIGAKKIHLRVPGSGGEPDTVIDEPMKYSFAVFHALTGDSIDNIKGIYRFPKKLAMELASKYKTVEELLENESDTKLKENADLLLKNEVQLTLKDCPVDTDVPKADPEAIKEFCQYYGLKKIYETHYGTQRQAEMFGGLA